MQQSSHEPVPLSPSLCWAINDGRTCCLRSDGPVEIEVLFEWLGHSPRLLGTCRGGWLRHLEMGLVQVFVNLVLSTVTYLQDKRIKLFPMIFNGLLSGASPVHFRNLRVPFFCPYNNGWVTEQQTWLKVFRYFLIASVIVSRDFIPTLIPRLYLAACKSHVYVISKERIASVLICSLLLLQLLCIISLYFRHKEKNVLPQWLHPDECVLFSARSEEGDLQGFWALGAHEHWYFWNTPCVWWMGRII